MGRGLKITLIAIGGLVIVIIGLALTGVLPMLVMMFVTGVFGPDEPFDGTGAVDAPDYSNEIYWAALPSKADPADVVPPGVLATSDHPVDVFFVHPTAYISNKSWTSPLDPDSATDENVRWMLLNQASAYNGCCNVYAPRYREISIYGYFQPPEKREKVLAFAYQDVVRAFDYFIDNYSNGRPFVIASHSQGTHHAMRLLKEKIDGTPLHDRMVAAYLIGATAKPLSNEYFASMTDIEPCESARHLGCVVHWDTMPEGADPIEREAESLCTNPLTWQVNEARAEAELNIGAVPISVPYNMNFMSPDEPVGHTYDSLDEPIPNRTWAQCREGTLFVAEQDEVMGMGAMGGSYHGYDYNLFYMDIRANAITRANAWLLANAM